VANAIALAIGILGVAGVIFTALKYNRDDTTAVLGQQDTILGEMKSLNDELRITVDRLRDENTALRSQVDELSVQVAALDERT
jgi:hypothetical protein